MNVFLCEASIVACRCSHGTPICAASSGGRSQTTAPVVLKVVESEIHDAANSREIKRFVVLHMCFNPHRQSDGDVGSDQWG